ncbi:MAG: Cna B-type domain-containing protein, partial [Clostridia bacterium]|nr:Cna B-type domain-containing protein [Clostridia bacterium]
NNQDGKRPSSIEVTLLANDKQYSAEGIQNPVQLSESNSWSHTWNNLPKYANGTEIKYEIKEIGEVQGYTSTSNEVGNVTTITNNHTPEETERTVKKVWEDNNNQDGKRPSSIEVTLLANDKQYSAEGIQNPVQLSESNSWSHTWDNLPKYANGTEINYEIKEIQVPDGYTSESIVQGNVTTITNKHIPELTERTVIKEWKDENDKQNRPEKITVILEADGRKVDEVELNKSNDWEHTWNDLPKYENGTEILYKIEEVKVEKYTTNYNVDGNTTTIINTPIAAKVKFKLTKKDSSGNELAGTNIKVTSSKSGEHSIDGKSNIEFAENDLVVGSTIEYKIEEINTVVNSAYVNVFKNPIYISGKVDSKGELQEVDAYMSTTSSNGEVKVPLSEVDFVEHYEISDPDYNGIQTIKLVLQNPTKFDFELVKQEANKNNGDVIPNTKFKITSSFSGEHTKFTNNKGTISFTETDVKAGDYSFKIQELEVPDENYVNILENKYIIVNVHVAADGTVTFKDESKKYTLYELIGNEITDSKVLEQYKKYIDVDIDDSSVIEDNKIKVIIKDPVKIGLELYKVATDGTPLADVEFTIKSSISNKTETDLTSRPSNSDTYGNIVIEEPVVDPGLYTFEITENETSNNRYENILKNRKIVIYAMVNSDGSIDLVNSEGNKFAEGTENKFYIQNSDGTSADNSVYNYVSINTSPIDGRDRVYVRVENPVKFNIDLVKVDSNNNPIDGAKFTVYRDKKQQILNQGEVSSKIEIEENNISKGTYAYYITENASPNSDKYVNILSGKFIKLNVDVQADGTVSILNNNGNKFEVYKGKITDENPTLIDKNDDIYSYIKVPDVISKDGEPNIVQIKVENPTQYEFDISKRNAADTVIQGSKFTAIREDENGTFVKILDNTSNLSKTESPIRAGNYIYYITENQSPGNQYINILEGKYIKMYITVSADGKVTITNSKFQASDGYYELYEGDIETRNGTKIENSEFITVEAPNPGSAIIYTVKVNVINPIGYNVDITKKDGANNVLSGAEFISVRENVIKNESTEIFSGEVTTNIEANETPMRAGNYIYYFTETKTPGNQYNNILEGKYVKVYVKVAGDGKVIITDSKFKESAGYYEIFEGNINNRTNSDKYISNNNEFIKVGVTTDGTIYTIGLEVINPVKYNININKKVYGEEEINLENVKMTLVSKISGTQSFITDENGNTPTHTENEIKPGIYKYLITENEAASEEFVNILQNKGVVVFLRVNSDGTIEIVDKDEHKPAENKYYICDITDSNNLKYLDNDIATKFVKVYTSTTDRVAELNFAIKNPQKYNFSIIKKDKDTDERMNGIAFELTTYNNGEVINLKDANTLQNINTTNLVTANVNGKDGVINVNNILFEKCGTYVFQLHEKAIEPSMFDWLYKEHKEDIKITIEVIEEDGQYVISKEKITQGMEYLDSVEFTDGLSAITTEVMNERIKGKYDLTIDKLDSYTEAPLDGAVFNIDVKTESGQNHDLYKATDNVNSKDVILPNTVTINNGKLEIQDIRIDRPETYIITLTETVAPKGYMLLDEPIKLKVTTTTDGEYDDEKFILEDVTLVSGKNYELVTLSSDENTISLKIKNEYFDLALRKSITSVAYPDSEDAKITEDETKDRNPKEITKDLDAGNNDTTAIYNHEKNPVRVYKGQEVIYTFRVYNEGEIDGYAEEITDHLPEGLEFLSKDEFNTSRGWTYDSTDTTLRTVKTTNLSKQYGEEHNQDNLIKARNKVTGDLDYKEIQIKCIVSDETKAKTTLTNIAEISKFKSIRTSETVDRDSQGANVEIPETEEAMSEYKNSELNKDYVPGQQDDDDFEKLIVEEFDLSLRKYITAINGEDMLAKEQSDDDSNNTQDEEQENTEENKENTQDKTDENTEANEEDTQDKKDENTEVNEEDAQDKTNENTEENKESAQDKTNGDTADEIKYEREPVVNVKPLEENTTAKYTHPKDPIEVSVDDIVRYTISVYNEGTVSGYASLVKDDIPEGLQYVKDSEINKEFNWKLLDENNEETDDVTKAKYIVTDYLAKENGEDNIINAFDGEKLDTKFVQVEFKVIVKQDYPKIIVNQAQISNDTDESGKGVKDRDSVPNEWNDGEDDQDEEFIKVTYLDLSLRKFITKVNDQNITNRIPDVNATALIKETGTTAEYTHTKDPVLVHTTDKVTYTIRVYNEGSKDGYATVVKDDIPDGLEFIVDDETNKKYEWTLLDENGKEVTDASKAKYVVTDYLSKDNETNERQNLMKAFDKETMKTPEFKDVKVAFKVVEPTTSDRIVINEAQIAKQTDGKGIHREDRDSVPNEWKGEDDEDIEQIKVKYFDLSLRKWVTKAIVVQNGQTFETETGHKAEDNPEEIVKVDLKKSKIDSLVVKFEYQIRVTNEGEVAGYATEIKDYIPEGLKFDLADNPNWVQVEDNVITTDQLKDTLLQPEESAEVTVILTWINSETNMGTKVNVAEISKDYNEYNTPDIDSTPNNKVEGEDDIDDAPVMLTVKTGSNNLRYILIALGVLAILGLGVSLIKETVKSKKS